MSKPLTIAVTGLNATDNPGPGMGVIRSLRLDPQLCARIVGLAYDTLEPGAYARDLIDDVYVIPYPSQGIEALAQRLRYIHDKTRIDVIIPTLDAELTSFIDLEDELESLGIRMFLPTRSQLDLRSKTHLFALGENAGIPVPASAIINEVEDLYSIHERIPYPFFVKGVFYGACQARELSEAIHGFHKTVAQWGLPVIIQQRVDGEERDLVAVGDGMGRLVGAVPMRKTYLTDKGKGWAGIAIKDPELCALAERFAQATHWRGPCEIEIIKDKTGDYHLLEVNPRFPAWCYLSAASGANLPALVARLAAGQAVEPQMSYEVGTMFVRISLDQIARIEELEQLATFGEIHRPMGSREETQ